MDENLKVRLIELAEKYENTEFLKKDPSQFMHRFENQRESEVAAFIAANLAFGKREQILLHVEQILTYAGKSPCEWILSRSYREFFPKTENSFYRMYSFNAMRIFFDSLNKILKESDSLGSHFKRLWENRSEDTKYLFEIIAEEFPRECTLISHSKGSAAKKLNMFLRWMVRTNSPVDMGFWTWYPKSSLLIPLDTHVMQEATKFGLIEKSSAGKTRSASLKTAEELSQKMQEVFPNDPCRADYALFGLGVNT